CELRRRLLEPQAPAVPQVAHGVRRTRILPHRRIPEPRHQLRIKRPRPREIVDAEEHVMHPTDRRHGGRGGRTPTPIRLGIRHQRQGVRAGASTLSPAHPAGIVTPYTFLVFTTWSSVNASYPHRPFSYPIPLHLAPPNGANKGGEGFAARRVGDVVLLGGGDRATVDQHRVRAHACFLRGGLEASGS